MRIFIHIPVEESPTQPLEKIKNITCVITEVLSDRVAEVIPVKNINKNNTLTVFSFIITVFS